MADPKLDPTQVQATLSALDETLLAGPHDADAGTSSPSLLDFGTRYDNERELGRGGMGVVDLANDRIIGRRVALKRIRIGEGTDARELRRRFVREARVQGQLEHPSIVPVYDFGIATSGEAFFTMKRIDGITLEEVSDRLARGDAAVGRPTLRAGFSRASRASVSRSTSPTREAWCTATSSPRT